MSYNKTNWQNSPSTNTPINAANLNHMEQGIYDATNTADSAAAGVAALQGLNFAPIPVTLAADMTDQNKIYVYLGSEAGYQNGHWYYWSGSAWTEGGGYNSLALVTDKTLSIADDAADSKATGDAISNLSDAVFTEFEDELGTIIETGWIGGKYIDTSGATVDINTLISNSNYSCIVLSCSEGDYFKIDVSGSNTAWPWVFIDSNGVILSTHGDNLQIDVELIAPTDSAYLVCNTKSVVHKKIYRGKSRIATIEAHLDTVDESLSLISNDQYDLGFTMIDKKIIEYASGNEVSNTNYHATGFIKLPQSTIIIANNFYNSINGTDGYAFYNASKAYISGGKGAKDKATLISVPKTAVYVRLCSRKSYEEAGVDRYAKAVSSVSGKSNNRYSVVMLGDSIIGNYNNLDSVPSYLEQFSGANCYNCAFGGSSMGTDTYGGVNTLLLPFRGFKVIEAITTNDYSDMEDAIADDPGYDTLKDYFADHVNTLKSMDWSKVDVITLSYGINDWLLSVTLDDNPLNAYDTNTTGGALRTALETLWATYPKIKVMICGPTWLGGTISGGEILWDSDDHQNNISKYLEQYSEKEFAISKEYHVPFCEMYNNTNFNKHTWKTYFPTGGTNAIHPNATGRYVIARRYAQHLSEL